MHNVILFILRQNVMSKCQCIFNLLLLNFGPASVDTSWIQSFLEPELIA